MLKVERKNDAAHRVIRAHPSYNFTGSGRIRDMGLPLGSIQLLNLSGLLAERYV